MLDQLLNYIAVQKLFQPEQKVLLAVSGGIDSMVMVHLFQQTNFKFAIAHCNFQLRGKASDEDQVLVEGMAKKWELPCFIKSFETEAYAKKRGISIQMSARDLRRAWFGELLKNDGFAVIAMAHHLNDSLETVLFNLAKGTGISGLKGILPKNENYIRPLMFATREMIFDYAQKNRISWREDKSNISVKYQRNLIRHKVVPELKKINPGLEDTLSHSLEKIAASERVYRIAIQQFKQKLIEKTVDGIRIEKGKLKKIDEAQIILFELIDVYGFNFQQVKDMLSAIGGQPGKSFYTHDYQLNIDRRYLFISKKRDEKSVEVFINEDTAQIEAHELQLKFEKVDVKAVNFSDDNYRIFLDHEKLSFPLVLREWRKGDRFQPLGMKHKKKLSDFMIDEKIPLNLKNQVRVLCSGDDLVWVLGHRIDDRYKITRQTKLAYKICNT